MQLGSWFKVCNDFVKVFHSPASVPLGFWLLWEWTPFILFLLEIPERKLAMLFQCLAKLLTWNCFWRCAIGIWLQVDRSHLPIFWFRAKLNATRDMIQSLQRLRESLPLSCKCAIGILAFLRMDTLYFVSFGDTRTQAGDGVSMLG